MNCTVEYTCPKIDEVLEAVEKVQTIAFRLQNYKGESIEELKDAFSDIDNHLYGMDSLMEEIREANSALRDLAERK